MAETVIEIRDLSKSYDGLHAVRDISLEIGRGELFGLIGPNGAGKTTLFRMLLGLVRPTSGQIKIRGVDVSRVWSREVRAHTGYLPENIVFYDQLSGLETLRFYASIKGAESSEVGRMLERVGLADSADRKVGIYSKGMRQRLGLAQALLGGPEILFLDEPTTGLDPEGIALFYEILNEVKARGVTIVLTSHILKEIQDRVDRLGIIGGGKLLASGSVRELRNSLGLKPILNVTVKDNPEDVKRAVLNAGMEIVSEGNDFIRISCLPGKKMEALKVLMDMGDHVADIELAEPSLDDVFIGYTEAGQS